MKYNLFIGRWCPFHNGHKYIIDTFVNNGEAVCIAIRDTVERYPVSLRKLMIRTIYPNEEMVKIIIIPDIKQVCTGRKVGYALVEVPKNIALISGTDIRESLGATIPTHDGWIKVPPEVKKIIDEFEKNE